MEKLNLIKLKNISLFKLAILLFISIYINNLYFYLFVVVILILTNKEALIIYLIIIFIIYLKPLSLINIVQIEECNKNEYLCSNIFYKARLETSNELTIGKILILKNKSLVNDKDDLKNNIIYNCTEYTDIKIYNHVKNKIHSIINEFPENIRNTFLGKTTYNNIFLGYGFGFYYFIKYIKKKNRYISIFILLLYILIIRFDIKFYLIIIDLILDKFKMNYKNKLSITLIILTIINKYLINNYSILIPLLIRFLALIKIKIPKSYFAIIQSYFFGSINLFSLFFHKLYRLLRIVLFLTSFLTIFLIEDTSLFIEVEYLISLVYKYTNMCINGKISFFGFILFLVINRTLNIRNDYIKIFLLIILFITNLNMPLAHITFIDVGQGDAILIRDSLGSKNILIDTGSTYNYTKLSNTLKSEGVYKLDYLIITHDDSDHNGNIENLVNDYKISNIIEQGENIITDSFSLQYLYIDDFDNKNDNSLVYLLNIDDYKILLTGDISKNAEKILIKKYILTNIDILKVSHHGSNTSSSRKFISSILPTYSIISTSGKYGHPHKETIGIFQSYKINILSTKIKGNITFYFSNIIDFMKTDSREFAIIR